MELAGLSSNSRMLVAEKSGHGIQIDQPGLVVDAIRQMVEATRQIIELGVLRELRVLKPGRL